MARPSKNGPPITTQCLLCGTEFTISAYKHINGRGKYCSRDCSDKSKLKYGDNEVRNCGVCGKEFKVKAYNKNHSTKGKFCSKECSYKGRVIPHAFKPGISYGPKTRIHSTETRMKMKQGHRASIKKGSNHANWNGGHRTERKQQMGRFEYKEWRSGVFIRDNYTCQCCGDSNVYLHADHIKEYSTHPELRYDIANGKTLCYRCHYKKTFPNVEFNEATAYKWGVPKKYRKEEPSYCIVF